MKRVLFIVEVRVPEDNSKASVHISCSGPHELLHQMIAVEHMMNMFAVSCDCDYERALESLCEGARDIHLDFLKGNSVQ